jgi:hypothetical protein
LSDRQDLRRTALAPRRRNSLSEETYLDALVQRAPPAVSLLNDVRRLQIFKGFLIFAAPDGADGDSDDDLLFKNEVERMIDPEAPSRCAVGTRAVLKNLKTAGSAPGTAPTPCFDTPEKLDEYTSGKPRPLHMHPSFQKKKVLGYAGKARRIHMQKTSTSTHSMIPNRRRCLDTPEKLDEYTTCGKHRLLNMHPCFPTEEGVRAHWKRSTNTYAENLGLYIV